MRQSTNGIIFFSCIIFLLGGIEVASSDEIGGGIGTRGANEVHIAPNGIAMPLGRILLVRKNSDYCAIKFSKFWSGKTLDDRYATYEAYYQDDKTGAFSNKNVKFSKEELHWPKTSFWLLGHPWAFGVKDEIQCGPIRLWWTGLGSAYFFKHGLRQGDYGIELTPTPWTDISQVNVFESRIKWYRYDETRKRVNIPIDQLWSD